MTFESINEVYIKWQKDLDNAVLGEIKQKAVEHGIKTEYLLNEKAIISALEKQIPKKPIKIERQPYFRKHYSKSFTCPKCNNSILGTGRPYCAFCGQALDWSDTE